jgi:hypothetical protein
VWLELGKMLQMQIITQTWISSYISILCCKTRENDDGLLHPGICLVHLSYTATLHQQLRLKIYKSIDIWKRDCEFGHVDTSYRGLPSGTISKFACVVWAHSRKISVRIEQKLFSLGIGTSGTEVKKQNCWATGRHWLSRSVAISMGLGKGVSASSPTG